jgi:threonine dehydrogenase-like Zn-dependent dehydrogenase
MIALRKTANGTEVADINLDKTGEEAIIKVVLSGICNTDLEIAKGYAGFEGTLGHEFVGIVESAPNATEWVGKRVLGEINIGCENCDWCRTHDSRHCPNRTVLGIIGRDGCHAEFVKLPVRNLIEVPADVPDERAVFAEPFAAALGITEQVSIEADTRVAVIGDGKLGILCAWALGAKSQHLFLIGKHPNKLKLGELGNAEGVLLENVDNHKRSFDVVVEASGTESGFETALDLVKPRGKIVLKSTFHGKPKWEAWRVVVDEITIVGSRCGMFSPVLELLKDASFPLEKLISDELSLAEGVRGLQFASESGVIKVLLRP